MNGSDVIKMIGTFAPEGRSAVMLRHAARFPIVDMTRPELAELTPEGSATAEAMGEQLRGHDGVRLFHSPVKRCQQTAECLARGARRAGVSVELAGAEEALGVEYILDMKAAAQLSVEHGDHFVRRWMDGQVPENVIWRTERIAAAKVDYVARKLAEPCRPGRWLDLHVSHDWNVMVLRERLLGVRHEEAGWLTFPDGVGFMLDGRQLLADYHGQRRVHALPELAP